MKAIQIVLYVSIQISLGLATTWTYADQTNWGGSCNDAVFQSPIDIPCQQYLNVCPPAKNYQVYWQNPMMQFGGSIYQDLKTFNVNNSWVRLSNQTSDFIFKSWQFHIHHPSEHTVNGKSYPMEMHLVHKLDHPTITQFLVIGILFEQDSTLNYDIFDSVKIDSNTTFTHLFPFALTNKPAYHYRGSLTTPPCLQAVNWFVQTEPIKIRPANLERLAGEGKNNRQVQRLGNRPVFVVGQGC